MAEPTPATTLLEMLHGYRAVQALYAAAQLGLADLLREGPRDAESLAQAARADARSLLRLLRALAGLGVLTQSADGRFTLTPLGELLRSDVPGSLRAAVLFYGGRRHWTAWAQLLDSVRSGKAAFAAASAGKFAEMASRDPAAAAMFNEAMAAMTGPLSESIGESFDFSGARLVVDVGGGYGALLASILTRHPHVRGVLFDIAPVVEQARSRIAAANLAQRCEIVAGDAFTAVPVGGDVYVLKWILHDWDDERCRTILTNCRRAMRADSRLLVIERVLPPRAVATPAAASAYLSDLNMMLVGGAAERTEQGYRSLLAEADLELRRVVPIAGAQHLLEATPR